MPRVAVLLPQTYMNESGRAVGPARGQHRLDLERLVVVHDEIDLPFGEVRARKGGGVAGHNGLKSVKQGVGGNDFWRVRTGVGRPDSTDPEIVSAHVLSRFAESPAAVRDADRARRRRDRAAAGARVRGARRALVLVTSSRAGLGRFATVLALPGVRPVLIAAFVGRLPIGMMSLSIVLLVSRETGSYATAGAVAATQALAGGVASPLLGRLIDRIGQTRVLVACGVAFPLSVGGLIAVASTVTELLPLVACAIPFGATYPPLFAATRALLTRMAGSADLAATAFAFEAIVQEAFFIAGPLLVALLVAIASPQAALACVAVVTSAGTLAFAATGASRAARGEAGPDRALGALASPGVRTLLVVSAAFGLAFGTLEVTMPAFADERGSAAIGGVLLAGLAGGSMLGGVWYGSRSLSAPLSTQMIRFCAVFAAALIPLAFAASIPLMLVLMALAGFFVAPWAATSAALVGRLAPAGAVTEAYTWEMTAVVAGFALGGVLSGVLVESAGVREALIAAAGAALASAAIAWARRETLRG